VLRSHVDQNVGSSREAEAPDAAIVDVAACVEELQRALDVAFPTPSPRVRRAFTLAPTSRVVEKDAVAVPTQESRVVERPSPVAATAVDEHVGRTTMLVRRHDRDRGRIEARVEQDEAADYGDRTCTSSILVGGIADA
jgi:hypothetical protein